MAAAIPAGPPPTTTTSASTATGVWNASSIVRGMSCSDLDSRSARSAKRALEWALDVAPCTRDVNGFKASQLCRRFELLEQAMFDVIPHRDWQVAEDSDTFARY